MAVVEGRPTAAPVKPTLFYLGRTPLCQKHSETPSGLSHVRPRALERRLDDGGQNEKEKEGAGLRSENRPHCAFAFQGMFGRDFTPHSAVEGAARLKWKLYHLLLATLPMRTVVTFSLFCQHRYAGFSVAPLNQIGLFFLFFEDTWMAPLK